MLIHHHSLGRAPSRVVILGERGFVASRLIRMLAYQNITCRPIGRAEIDLIQPGAAEELLRILTPQDTVVVTAALTPEHGRDQATFLKNVAIIENVCRCLSHATCAQVVYVSSDSVYDSRFTEIDEETPCGSNDPYAMAHIRREELIAEVCQRARIPLAIVRPCAIYGAGDTHNSYGPNRFLRTALTDGKITLFGQGEEERDHVYIDDVTHILSRCLLHRSAGVLNAVSGIALPFHDVACKIALAVGTTVRIEMAPRKVPITHRRFRPTAIRQAFPHHVATLLDDGIGHSIAELVALAPGRGSAGSAP